MPLPLQRLTAWLCLLAALIAGSTPAQGFVVCLESDGCVRVELANSAAGCGACDGHDEDAAPASELSNGAEDADCPCVDLSLPGVARAQRVLPKPVELQWVSTPLPCTPCFRPSQSFEPRGLIPPRAAPRPPDALALIQSVVLLT